MSSYVRTTDIATGSSIERDGAIGLDVGGGP